MPSLDESGWGTVVVRKVVTLQYIGVSTVVVPSIGTVSVVVTSVVTSGLFVLGGYRLPRSPLACCRYNVSK